MEKKYIEKLEKACKKNKINLKILGVEEWRLVELKEWEIQILPDEDGLFVQVFPKGDYDLESIVFQRQYTSPTGVLNTIKKYSKIGGM